MAEPLTLKPMFRMPVSFGPAPGPRNVPRERAHLRYRKDTVTLTLSAATDGERLARMLPEGFALRGEPRIEVSVMLLSNVGWLAGRGYNIVLLRIPAEWSGEKQAQGFFVPVVWESMADPILTGRDELGWCKINAAIPAPTIEAGRWRGGAEWEGFRFFEFSAEGFAPASPGEAPLPMMFQKYIPRTGEWGMAEISHATIVGADEPRAEIHSIEQGRGTFAFRPARWEDMPTQYPIVNALADLPLGDFAPARLVRSSGGGDVSGQRILR